MSPKSVGQERVNVLEEERTYSMLPRATGSMIGLGQHLLNNVTYRLDPLPIPAAPSSTNDNSAVSEAATMKDQSSQSSRSSRSSIADSDDGVTFLGAKSPFMTSIDRLRSHFESGNSAQSGYMTPLSDQNSNPYRNAPIFSSSVASYLDSSERRAFIHPFEQYGLIGMQEKTNHDHHEVSSGTKAKHYAGGNMLIANTDTPSSTFICGSQGAGKSHTMSCLLENALITNNSTGQLPKPLTAIIFHYDNYTSAASTQLCEAAYLCSSGVPVNVLVSPSNIWAMTKLYNQLPGLPTDGPKPKVLPLYLSESQLDISTMLKLMSVDPSADRVPLYMEAVMTLLRDMAMEGKGAGSFSYREFRARLDQMVFTKDQMGPLNLRLQLLDAFLEPSEFSRTTRPARAKGDIWSFEPGTLTIVDLSDPFVNSDDACALFSICLSLFLSDRAKCGRVVALDEAHKFLTQSGEARILTQNLISVIRQQRHTGTRVIIATQEPTLSPEIIDLCNATFVHRFNSPAWFQTLKEHLAGANKHGHEMSKQSLFETIATMETGEALLFCPTALVDLEESNGNELRAVPLGNRYVKVKIRQRITTDGGRSVLASETGGSVSVNTQQIEMHVVTKPVNEGYKKVRPLPERPAPETKTFRSEVEHSTAPNQQAAQTISTLPLRPMQLPLTPKMRGKIERYTKTAVWDKMSKLGWKKENDIRWDQLIEEVERAIGATFPQTRERASGLKQLKGIARDELFRSSSTKN